VVRGHSSQIRHRNQSIVKEWKKAVQKLGKEMCCYRRILVLKTSDPIKQTKVKLNEENVMVRTIEFQGNRNKLESIVEPMIKIMLLVVLKESCYAKFNDRSTHI